MLKRTFYLIEDITKANREKEKVVAHLDDFLNDLEPIVMFLEMKPEISLELVKKRSAETGQKQDIHELDPDYMHRSYKAALYACDKLGWKRIVCYCF